MIFLSNPIPFSKGSTDSSAIKKMFSVIKQNGSIGMFISGNRSFFGEECTIKPGIGKLVKKMGVPVVLVRMRGGYNTKARWKSSPNKGKMRVAVTRIVSPEELKTISSEQLDDIIKNELYFKEFEWNSKEKIPFYGKHKAEFLERVLFFCPECKEFESCRSKGNEFFCVSCGMRVKIDDFGFFEKINNAQNCPDTILEWSKMQLEYIKSFDYSDFKEKPVFGDQDIRFSCAIRSKKDELLSKGEMKLFADRLWICGNIFTVESIMDIAIQSYNRLMIYTDKGEFTVDMPERSNAMKYMICCYHLRNIALNIQDAHYGY
jgi:hypothetical protein